MRIFLSDPIRQKLNLRHTGVYCNTQTVVFSSPLTYNPLQVVRAEVNPIFVFSSSRLRGSEDYVMVSCISLFFFMSRSPRSELYYPFDFLLSFLPRLFLFFYFLPFILSFSTSFLLPLVLVPSLFLFRYLSSLSFYITSTMAHGQKIGIPTENDGPVQNLRTKTSTPKRRHIRNHDPRDDNEDWCQQGQKRGRYGSFTLVSPGDGKPIETGSRKWSVKSLKK